MNDKAIISTEELKMYFNGGAIKALDGVSADIHEGEVVVVIGPSGSGKSTFLRCLKMLEKPTGGYVIFDGIDLTNAAVKQDKVGRFAERGRAVADVGKAAGERLAHRAVIISAGSCLYIE